MPLAVKVFVIDDLLPFEGNPRLHNDAVIQDSLKGLGQFKPIVVNAGTKTGRVNEVLAGNGTLDAARSLGWTKIDGVLLDVDNVTAKKINAVDNRSNDLASYDNELLATLLSEIASEDDLAATGFSEADLEKMLTKGHSVEGDAAVDDNLIYTFGVVIECASEDEQKRVLQEQIDLGRTCRALI
jgi:ParB-like chromosome segregation protein Spo0J